MTDLINIKIFTGVNDWNHHFEKPSEGLIIIRLQLFVKTGVQARVQGANGCFHKETWTLTTPEIELRFVRSQFTQQLFWVLLSAL
jgi:hypothetical protein